MSDRPQAIAPSTNGHALPVTYSNYFRASGSAEELILDFGLDPQRRTDDGSMETIVLQQRVVLTWGNAQRLARLLKDLLQLHEENHVRRPNANRPPNPACQRSVRPPGHSIVTGEQTPSRSSRRATRLINPTSNPLAAIGYGIARRHPNPSFGTMLAQLHRESRRYRRA